MNKPADDLQKELESVVLRRLIDHLRNRPDVQNIDLMTLAGFCRNCLSNWYEEAARARGLEVTRDDARQHIYGMPYEEWKAKYQTEASPDASGRTSKTDDHKAPRPHQGSED